MHGSTSDTLVIPVDLSDFVQPTQLIVAKEVLDEFVSWIHNNYSSLESLNADNYHLYAISNMAIGGSGTWVAVNDTWELHFGWGGNRYGLISRFLLRRMGEYKPSYYFLKESEREWFNDIIAPVIKQ
jgi:hypothetical protein